MVIPRTRLDLWRNLDIRRIAEEIFAYVAFALIRFRRDQGMQSASSLTYTTLLSLVPLLAIAFAIFAAFPAFESVRGQLEETIFHNLVPGVGGDVREYMNKFLRNTGQLGTVGVVALGLSAVLLLATIEATFNRIWRVERPRPLLVRFLVYWGVLTLGPLLIGAGISLTTDVFSVAREGLTLAGLDSGSLDVAVDDGGPGEQLLSVVLQTVFFTVLFAVVPNRRVTWRDALIGGFVSGAGFQILKTGFAWYLANVLTYQTIYGAMAVFPIFLIWLYLSWCVVLLGAVFSASFPDWWRARTPSLESRAAPGRTLATAILVLAALRTAQRDGRSLSEAELGDAAGAEEIDPVLASLQAHGFVAPTEAGTFLLSRDLAAATAFALYDALGLTVVGPHTGDTSAPDGLASDDFSDLPPHLARLVSDLHGAERKVLDQPLDTIVAALDHAEPRPAVEIPATT